MPRWHGPAEVPGVAPAPYFPSSSSGHGAWRIRTGLASITLRPLGEARYRKSARESGSVELVRGRPRYAIAPGVRRDGRAGKGSAVRTRFLTDRFAAYKARRQQVTATQGGRDESLSRRQQHSGRKAPERGELPGRLHGSCAAFQSRGQQRAQQRRDQPCAIFSPQLSSSQAGDACPGRPAARTCKRGDPPRAGQTKR